MKSLICGFGLILFAVVISTTSARLLTISQFRESIRPHCYNVTDETTGKLWTAGQLTPLANSVENFISLVEKLERKTSISGSSIETVIKKLTAWFTIHDLEMNERISKGIKYKYLQNMETVAEFEKRMIDWYLLSDNDYDSLQEAFRVYNENEVCSLYYMLSHTVNKTRTECFTQQRYDGSSPLRTVRQNAEDEGSIRPVVRRNGELDCALEQGVVSINSEDDEAVAISRVLFGIYAALKSPGTRVDAELIKDVTTDSEDLKKSLTCDILHGFTLGAVFGRAIIAGDAQDNPDRLGYKGRWNSTRCTTEYEMIKIPAEARIVTTAELKGAIDGLIIGTSVRQLKSNGGQIPSLSQLLRMYYKKTWRSNTPSVIPRYCDRQSRLDQIMQEAEKDVMTMSMIFYWKLMSISPRDPDFQNQWSDVKQEFEKFRRDGLVTKACSEMEAISNELPCDTPSNVLMVLDERSEMETQKEIAADLANSLDLNKWRSSITIVTNTFQQQQTMGIVSWNATSNGCPGCQAMWYNPEYGSRTQDDGDILDIVNRTFGDLERPRLEETGVGSKVLIYMKYTEQTGNDGKVNAGLNRLKSYHRDIRILGGLGSAGARRFLEKITRDNTDIIAMGSPEESVAKLQKAVCGAPALLQYKDCETGQGKKTYEGFVVPGTIQYWAMYPQYFLKSFNIKFFFRAETGSIKVCHSRYTRTPEQPTKSYRPKCETFNEGDTKDVEFRISNPCDGRNVHNCDPFYFSIEGRPNADESRQHRCFDPKCKTSDAIRFIVRHEGVQCSGALNLLASPLQLLGTLFAIFYILNKQN